MDNLQGDYQTEQVSGDDDIQNNVDPNVDLDLATETLQQVQLNPSSSSLIVENDQRIPVTFHEPNINPPHQDILPNNGVIGGFWLPEPVGVLGSSSGSLIGIPQGFPIPYTLSWTNFLHYQGESSSEPSQPSFQDGYHPFLNPTENTMGASATNNPSVHPFGYANFNEGLNVMPFSDHRNINGNVILGPYATNFHSIYEASANYPGYYNFLGNFYPSNVPTWVPLANVFQHQIQIPTGTLNNPIVQDMDPHNIAVGGARPPDTHAVVHYEPYFTTLLTSPVYDMRNWLEATWVYSTLEILRTQFEQWTLLDYAWLVTRILDERRNINQPIEEEEEELEFMEDDIPNELLGLIIFEDEDEHVGMGLGEEEIMTHIRLEKFECVDEETPPEICCICQDDIVNGEEVGRLDCVHRFHVGCIKEWLVRRNICPICRRTALAIDNDEDA